MIKHLLHAMRYIAIVASIAGVIFVLATLSEEFGSFWGRHTFMFCALLFAFGINALTLGMHIEGLSSDLLRQISGRQEAITQDLEKVNARIVDRHNELVRKIWQLESIIDKEREYRKKLRDKLSKEKSSDG